MFEISKNLKVNIQILDNSKIFIIDNFYEYPDKIVDHILSFPSEYHKNFLPSYNGIHFEDRRHVIENFEIHNVYSFLEDICCQKSKYPKNLIFTNYTKFGDNQFNDYENNYWWPHIDYGYTAIVYMNRGDCISGTNLYLNICPDLEPPNVPEHLEPWRPRERFEVIKSLEPSYNRLVLFDAKKFVHGMNVCNSDYFGYTHRLNQVFFFQEP